MGGVATTLIEANTTIPCEKTQTFSTAADNQTEVTINLLQGNRPMAAQNKSLGRFNLTGILPAKRGIPQIDVKVSINANGVVEVSATDKGTGKAQSIRIEGASGLSKEEIERMKAEAEANAESDKKEREIAEAVNKGDSIAFTQEKMLEDQKDNINSDEKEKLEGLISQMKDAVKAKDVDKINELEASINEVWQGISQRVYGQQQAQNNASEQQQAASEDFEAATGSTEDIKDAEFEEVK
jgi:molecular chaperone DnaK